MGIVSRKYNVEKQTFRSRLSKPLRTIAELMPQNFSDEEYYDLFKLCYLHLWDDIKSFSKECRSADQRRLLKHKTRVLYNIPNPEKYLILISKVYRTNKRVQYKRGCKELPEQERFRKVEILKNASIKILKKRKKVASERLILKQTVKPQYMNYFLREFFSLRKRHPEDIDSRYLILCEAAKFKCSETVDFLQKINACEKNIYLRKTAFKMLQQMGENVRLSRNRKEKKTKSILLEPTIVNTPDQLLKEIYNSQLEQKKSFDIFLSHSVSDENELLKLKTMINAMGLSVYIDWVNDKDKLKRDLVCKETAQVIIERLKVCNTLLYVLTERCLLSKWSPWELGYFTALKKKICVYTPKIVASEIPEYLDIYPKLLKTNNKLVIVNNEQCIDFLQWLKG